jgi:hypothetical protein
LSEERCNHRAMIRRSTSLTVDLLAIYSPLLPSVFLPEVDHPSPHNFLSESFNILPIWTLNLSSSQTRYHLPQVSVEEILAQSQRKWQAEARSA